MGYGSERKRARSRKTKQVGVSHSRKDSARRVVSATYAVGRLRRAREPEQGMWCYLARLVIQAHAWRGFDARRRCSHSRARRRRAGLQRTQTGGGSWSLASTRLDDLSLSSFVASADTSQLFGSPAWPDRPGADTGACCVYVIVARATYHLFVLCAARASLLVCHGRTCACVASMLGNRYLVVAAST